jgi:hypothetical protein
VPIAPDAQQNNGQPGAQQFRNQSAIPGGQPGFPGQPVGTPQAPGNQATNLISQLLTTPRQPPGGAPLPGGITPGAIGIAGVASTSTAASIKRYKERGKYSEWEFVFDLAQQQQQQQQGAQPRPGTPGQTGTPAGPPTSLFPSPTPNGLNPTQR